MKQLAFTFLCVFGFVAGAHAQQVCRDSIPASTPTESFQILDDGTAIDNTTNLMWSRCNVGQQYIEGDCVGSSQQFYWTEALDTSENSTLAGHSDWRVPNFKELMSLVENRCANPNINLEVFPNTGSSDGFWSSTPAVGETSIWVIYISGPVGFTEVPDYEPYNIKLVRDIE